MNYEYTKSSPVRLKGIGKDEKWLQDLVCQDPSVLGLGDLVVIQRERMQPTGGRIDIILSDPEENVRYEVEIMLGTVDESHIIRSIEYWDVERRRFPAYEHRAVIIAEEITNRFFNVIGLLNKAVPMIAIQLNAFLIDSKLTLNFVKVLDMVVEEEEEEAGELVDRKYWESRASQTSLDIVDSIIAQIPKEAGDLRIKYNRSHVALGTTGTNFCWFHPRKSSHVHLHIKVGSEVRESILAKFEELGIESGLHRTDSIKIVLTKTQFDQSKEMIKELMVNAEMRSRK